MKSFSAVNLTQFGFTVTELLIVMSIGGILAAIAVPSFRDMLNSTRQNSALGLVISDLNQARGEAIKRNTPVLVCGRNAGGTDCAAVAWTQGWLVCVEGAVPGQCAASTITDPNPLTVRPPLTGTLTMTSTADPVRFRANSTGTAATLTLAGTTNRTVAVAATGNITKQ